MRAILDICERHGQAPSWWETLDRGDQVLLVANYRLRQSDG